MPWTQTATGDRENADFERRMKLAKKKAKNKGQSVMQSQHVDWGRQGRLMEEAAEAKAKAEAKAEAEEKAKAPQNWPKAFSLRGGRRRRRKSKRRKNTTKKSKRKGRRTRKKRSKY